MAGMITCLKTLTKGDIMKCECGKELTGKQKYCSPACRKKASRGSVTSEPTSVTGSVTKEVASVTMEHENVTVQVPSVTKQRSVTSSVTHPDRDNIYSRHFDVTEEGFRRRNKAWDDPSRFSGTPTQQEAARKINRQIMLDDCIRINQEHVSNMVSEDVRRAKHEQAMAAIAG